MSQKHSLLTLSIAAAAANQAALVFIDYNGALPAAGGHTAGVVCAPGVNVGDLLPVDVLGTSVVTAGAAITVGQRVMSDANGNAVPWVAGVSPAVNYVAGVALEAAAASGATIEIAIVPN
jgi:hypothetical protein